MSKQDKDKDKDKDKEDFKKDSVSQKTVYERAKEAVQNKDWDHALKYGKEAADYFKGLGAEYSTQAFDCLTIVAVALNYQSKYSESAIAYHAAAEATKVIRPFSINVVQDQMHLLILALIVECEGNETSKATETLKKIQNKIDSVNATIPRIPEYKDPFKSFLEEELTIINECVIRLGQERVKTLVILSNKIYTLLLVLHSEFPKQVEVLQQKQKCMEYLSVGDFLHAAEAYVKASQLLYKETMEVQTDYSDYCYCLDNAADAYEKIEKWQEASAIYSLLVQAYEKIVAFCSARNIPHEDYLLSMAKNLNREGTSKCRAQVGVKIYIECFKKAKAIGEKLKHLDLYRCYIFTLNLGHAYELLRDFPLMASHLKEAALIIFETAKNDLEHGLKCLNHLIKSAAAYQIIGKFEEVKAVIQKCIELCEALQKLVESSKINGDLETLKKELLRIEEKTSATDVLTLISKIPVIASSAAASSVSSLSSKNTSGETKDEKVSDPIRELSALFQSVRINPSPGSSSAARSSRRTKSF